MRLPCGGELYYQAPARICPVLADNPHRAHRIPSRPYFCLCNEANMLFPARTFSYLFGPDKFAQLSAAGQPSRFPSLASASFALTTFIHPPGISHQLAILRKERSQVQSHKELPSSQTGCLDADGILRNGRILS